MLLNSDVGETLESPLDCKEIKPVYPKGNHSEYSLEGLMLKLILQYFGHLMQRNDSLETPWCWERLKAGGEGNGRGWDGWMASPTQWTWVWAGSGVMDREPWHSVVHGVTQSLTQLSDWTELISLTFFHSYVVYSRSFFPYSDDENVSSLKKVCCCLDWNLIYRSVWRELIFEQCCVFWSVNRVFIFDIFL